eukprot:3215599-Pleurochrysis_carterae.AAC.1
MANPLPVCVLSGFLGAGQIELASVVRGSFAWQISNLASKIVDSLGLRRATNRVQFVSVYEASIVLFKWASMRRLRSCVRRQDDAAPSSCAQHVGCAPGAGGQRHGRRERGRRRGQRWIRRSGGP